MQLDIDGLHLLALGLLIRYHVGKSRFNRRNAAGLQMFSSYLASIVISFTEKVLCLIGLLLILLGVIASLF